MSFFLFAILASRNPLGEPLQFAFVHNVVGYHPNQELFHRPAAKPLDDLPNRLGRHILRRVEPAVDVGASLDAMLDIPLLFEPFEDGANGRLFHRMALRQRVADIFGSERPTLPDHFHDEMFEVAERLSRSSCAKHCSATNCSECGGRLSRGITGPKPRLPMYVSVRPRT